ncbi:MAG: hypothetical protein IJX13_04610, partial [Clostridia bacterium]|nr:hypothetical protein [Clostridia bacterium]
AALEITKYGAGYITFLAPHFSEFALVNKYYIGIANDYGWDDALGTKPALGAAIATTPFESGYYEIGYKLTVGAIELTEEAKNAGLEYLYTEIVGGDKLEKGDVYVVSGAAEFKHYATTRTYYIYFYVGGVLDDTQSYTKFTTLPTYAGITQLAGENGFWYGVTAESFANDLCKKDMFLFLITDKADATITVNFKDQDGKVLLTYTKTTAEWYTEFAYLASNVASALSELSTNRVTVWKDANGKALSEYTLADLLSAQTVDFVAAEYSDRAYTIFTDGNVSVAGSALAGDLVEVTVNQKVGMSATVVIIDATGASVAFADGKFVMPASDVTISVTYAPVILTYWNINGEKVEVPYGTSITYTVTIPKDYFVDVTALTANGGALAGWTLVSSSTNEAGDLVLTYSMILTASEPAINLQTIDTGLAELKYQDIYVVDGKYYYSKADAEAALPEGVSAEWRQGAYKNLYFASLQYTADDSAVGLIVLCIVLGLIVLILIIALLYTLYICGKLKPNWFLKGITAIVSAFFAVCMAVAAAGLAIAKLFGYKEEDLMEELPDEELPEIENAEDQEVVESVEEQAEADVIDEVIVADETEAVVEDEMDAEEAPVVESEEETVEADVVEEVLADDAIEVTVEDATEDVAIEAEVEEVAEEVATEAEAEEVAEEAAIEAEAEEVAEEAATEAEAEEVAEEAAIEAEAEEVVEEAATEAEAEDEEKKDE